VFVNKLLVNFNLGHRDPAIARLFISRLRRALFRVLTRLLSRLLS